MKDNKISYENLVAAGDILKSINRNIYAYFEGDKNLSKEFNKKYYDFLFYKNSLPFDESFIKHFEIMMRVLSVYRNVNAFYQIRLLMDTRYKYIENGFDNINIEYDVNRYSKYLIAYGYYYDIPISKIDSMLSYFVEHYDEIIDWCMLNDGVAKLKIDNVRFWPNIIDPFYPYVNNYLSNKINNKQIL